MVIRLAINTNAHTNGISIMGSSGILQARPGRQRHHTPRGRRSVGFHAGAGSGVIWAQPGGFLFRLGIGSLLECRQRLPVWQPWRTDPESGRRQFDDQPALRWRRCIFGRWQFGATRRQRERSVGRGQPIPHTRTGYNGATRRSASLFRLLCDIPLSQTEARTGVPAARA